MKTTAYRTTFVLDEDTAQQAQGRPGAVVALQRLLESGGGLVRETAKKYLAEVRKARKTWRGRA